MMTTTPNTVYNSYTMDYQNQVHFAMRADGQWFTRIQSRHPRFGYRWGAWRPTSTPSADRVTFPTTMTARLPKRDFDYDN